MLKTVIGSATSFNNGMVSTDKTFISRQNFRVGLTEIMKHTARDTRALTQQLLFSSLCGKRLGHNDGVFNQILLTLYTKPNNEVQFCARVSYFVFVCVSV